MEREIVVRGTGQARALPDTAGLRVEVTADAKTHDEAYAARTELATKVDAALAAHATAGESRLTEAAALLARIGAKNFAASRAKASRGWSAAIWSAPSTTASGRATTATAPAFTAARAI